jgi:hypothetical protein
LPVVCWPAYTPGSGRSKVAAPARGDTRMMQTEFRDDR